VRIILRSKVESLAASRLAGASAAFAARSSKPREFEKGLATRHRAARAPEVQPGYHRGAHKDRYGGSHERREHRIGPEADRARGTGPKRPGFGGALHYFSRM